MNQEVSAIDLSLLEQLRDMGGTGGEGIIRSVVQIFLAKAPATLNSIGFFLDRLDYEQAGLSAHKLKSGAGNIGARGLIRHLDRLESCEPGLTQASRRNILEDIRVEYKRIEAELLKTLGSSSSG